MGGPDAASASTIDHQHRPSSLAETEAATELRATRGNNFHNSIDMNDLAGGGRSDRLDSVPRAVP